jgi:hypothetical protein
VFWAAVLGVVSLYYGGLIYLREPNPILILVGMAVWPIFIGQILFVAVSTLWMLRRLGRGVCVPG